MNQLEQRMREQFFENCDKHITHAQEKHPVFAYKINSRFNAVKYKVLADDHRQFRDEEHKRKESSIEVILLGEVYEFMEAFSRGDLEAAKEEAADVVAVLFRAIKWASISGIPLAAQTCAEQEGDTMRKKKRSLRKLIDEMYDACAFDLQALQREAQALASTIVASDGVAVIVDKTRRLTEMCRGMEQLLCKLVSLDNIQAEMDSGQYEVE